MAASYARAGDGDDQSADWGCGTNVWGVLVDELLEHLDIGQGEVAWDLFFGTLDKLDFGGNDRAVMTSCVFAWEDRAVDSSRFMRTTIDSYVSAW